MAEKSSKSPRQETTTRPDRRQANTRLPVNGQIADVLHLQRTVGNAAVGNLLDGGKIGRFRIGPAGDIYEREADRVAQQVMRMPEPSVQRAPT